MAVAQAESLTTQKSELQRLKSEVQQELESKLHELQELQAARAEEELQAQQVNSDL